MTLTRVGALSFVCSCQRTLQVAVCRGTANGSNGGSASERKIRTWFPRRQPRSMRLAVGVRSADPVFVTVIVHFQVVGHLFTAFAITQHGHVWRMVKLEKLTMVTRTVTISIWTKPSTVAVTCQEVCR